MTSIKPPATGPHIPTEPAGPTDSLPSAAPSAGERATGGSFEHTLQDARAAHSTRAGQANQVDQANQQSGETTATQSAAEHATASTGNDPIAGLAREMQSGRLGMDQALEQLLDRAVHGLGAQLSSVQRSELAGLLRDALAHDPTLRALRDDRG